MRRLKSLVLALVGATALALGASAASAAEQVANHLYVFGDSYSDPSREAFDDWVEQLAKRGEVNSVKSYARSGATAAPTNTAPNQKNNTFAKQIATFKKDHVTFGTNDAVVVFFGLNDIVQQNTTFTGSRDG